MDDPGTRADFGSLRILNTREIPVGSSRETIHVKPGTWRDSLAWWWYNRSNRRRVLSLIVTFAAGIGAGYLLGVR